MRRAPLVVGVAVLSALSLVLVIWLLRDQGLERTSLWSGVIALVVTVVGTAVGIWSGVTPGAPRRPVIPTGTQPRHQASVANADGRSVPRQLPPAVRHFSGRARELEELTGLVDEAAAKGGTVLITAIDGTAGIGKTAMAVHWAHRIAEHFPDGQLYVNLRGFDPTGSPMPASEAVCGFLDALAVPPERIPAAMEAQTSLYRSLIAGRRLLVVLDNARDTEQVRPLLPGTPGCLVVVTSRNRLTGLLADGAHPLSLDLFSTAEARELLGRRVGEARLAAEPQAVEEIIARCARLPLALSVVGARAANHRGFALASLVRELREHGGGLDAFGAGDPAYDVRTVFSWSYRQLSPAGARMFRLLALHPGPSVAGPAAASLAGEPVRDIRQTLAELVRAHLIDVPAPDRFGFHDLLRAYADELVRAGETASGRQAAVLRVLDHYLQTAHAAALLLYPRTTPIPMVAPQPGVTPEDLVDLHTAWAWFDAERPVLLATIDLATAAGQDAYAWRLAVTSAELFERRGHWHDCAATQHIAVAAAERAADRYGQAYAHRGLGRAYRWLGCAEEAHAHLRRAFHLFEQLGDQASQADTLLDYDAVFEDEHRLEEALDQAERALALSRSAGVALAQARALNNVGWYHALLQRPNEALVHCEQALVLTQELGDRRNEAHTLHTIGYAHHHLGNHREAAAAYQRSLALREELGERFGSASVLTDLGDSFAALSETAAARDAWQRALEIFEELGHRHVARVRARLSRLDGPTRLSG